MKSENILAVELLRYYQQKETLKLQEKEYNNPKGFVNLMQFYTEKINSLRTQLDENYPKRLQEIDTRLSEADTKRAINITVKGTTIVP
jgi:hypothetical protein